MNKSSLIFCLLMLGYVQEIISMKPEAGTYLVEVENKSQWPFAVQLMKLRPKRSSVWGNIKGYEIDGSAYKPESILRTLIPYLNARTKQNLCQKLDDIYHGTNRARRSDERYFCLLFENLRIERPASLFVVKTWKDKKANNIVYGSLAWNEESHGIEPNKQHTQVTVAIEDYLGAPLSATIQTTRVE